MHFRKILASAYRKCVKVFSGYGFRRFYIIYVTHNFIISHIKFAEVEGHKMFLDSHHRGISIHGTYDPFETEVLKNQIKKGDVVLDLGANIGFFTLIFAKLVGEEGKVFAFEPDPDNFSLLKKNIEINGYQNVILVHKAVSNETGKTRLYLSSEASDHRIYDSYDGRKSIEIETTRLDDYFNKYNGRIDFIKMDVQGAEWAVIKGASSLLQKTKNLKITTEFWPIGLKRFGVEPQEYLKLLLKHCFQLYNINEKARKIEPVNITKLLETYTIEKENFTNLLLLR